MIRRFLMGTSMAAALLVAQVGSTATLISENFEGGTANTPVLTAGLGTTWDAWLKAVSAPSDEGTANVILGANGTQVLQLFHTTAVTGGFGLNVPVYLNADKTTEYAQGTLSIDFRGINGPPTLACFIKLCDTKVKNHDATLDSYDATGAISTGTAWTVAMRAGQTPRFAGATNQNLPAPNWAANTEYRITVNWDIAAGATLAIKSGAPDFATTTWEYTTPLAKMTTFTGTGVGAILVNIPSANTGQDMQVDNIVVTTPDSTVGEWEQF